MKVFRKFGVHFLIHLIEITCLFLGITFLYYYNLLSSPIYSFLKFLILFLSLFFHSFLLGKESVKKGYWQGFKYGCFFLLLSFVLTILFGKFQFKMILYYFLILATSSLGGMVGIYQKKETNG